MRDKDYCENAPLDWSRPTNAVPGVEDLMRMREAERVARTPNPEPPIFSVRGFGGRSCIEHVPKRLHTVPGVGEDFSKMLAKREAHGHVPGVKREARHAMDQTREEAGEQEASLREASLRKANMILALQAHALEFIEGARRAGRAARELCQEYLTRERPRLVSREAEEAARLHRHGRMGAREEERSVTASPTL